MCALRASGYRERLRVPPEMQSLSPLFLCSLSLSPGCLFLTAFGLLRVLVPIRPWECNYSKAHLVSGQREGERATTSVRLCKQRVLPGFSFSFGASSSSSSSSAAATCWAQVIREVFIFFPTEYILALNFAPPLSTSLRSSLLSESALIYTINGRSHYYRLPTVPTAGARARGKTRPFSLGSPDGGGAPSSKAAFRGAKGRHHTRLNLDPRSDPSRSLTASWPIYSHSPFYSPRVDASLFCCLLLSPPHHTHSLYSV